MSVANKSLSKWYKVAGIGIACSLVLTGCNRSEKEEATETAELTEETAANENAAATAVSCDDPMVQDRLKSALKNTLNQQAQTLAASYANDAEIGLSGGVVTGKTNGIVIDVQNAAVLQATNDNGMTTCQASVSMTLPSEDLYQASQLQAANNQPSLQSRLANDNIRINNNMLVDDAFTYVVGTQGGQVRTRIAGQPALLTVVSEVVAGSAFQAALEEQRAVQAAERRRQAAQNNSENQTSQPRPVTPAAPVRPAEPATPPTVNQNSSSQNSSQNTSNQDNQSNNQTAPTPSSSASATPAAPKSVPKDDSIDMVIIEDKDATY